MLQTRRDPEGDEALTMSYGAYTVRPSVHRIAEGESFGGMWVIASCSFGRSTRAGYEVRFLLGDNDHFPTRREAVAAAHRRARQTIKRREVNSMHLTLEEALPLRSRG